MKLRLWGVCLLSITVAGCHKEQQQPKADTQERGGPQPSNNVGQRNRVRIDPGVQEKVGMQSTMVQSRAVPVAFTAPGRIVLNEERTAHVGSYTDGRVVNLEAEIGTLVRRGEVLAKLHSHTVHETRAALASAQEEVTRQQENVDYRRRMRDRLHRLGALKFASPQELERAEAELHSAETDLQNARISQNKETIHLADLLGVPESGLRQAGDTSELSPILAPISGVVVDRKVTLGTIVEPGQEAFVISDLGSVWMIASVNENDLHKLHIGSAARVITQSYPDQPFRGKVTFIAPEADPQTRTLQARILLNNRSRELHPGTFANAQIEAGPSTQAIFIPERSIQDVNGGSVVFVKRQDAVFEARPVRITRRLNGEAQIAEGLKPGEAIVTDGSFVVKSELLKSQIGQ